MNIGIGGPLSSGKSVSLHHLRHILVPHKPCISNMSLTDGSYHLSDLETVRFLKLNLHNQQALRDMFAGKVWLIDEIWNLLNARQATSAVNALVLSFIMMCGKLDTDVIFSYQVKSSQVDLMLREIMNMSLRCQRFRGDGSPVLSGDRIIKNSDGSVQPILILLKGYEDMGIFGQIPFMELFDPSPYYKLYDTRQIMLLDRVRAAAEMKKIDKELENA